ncbi:MAG TPA: SLBB domain-containing protein [Longimicrobium sp.]|jgi:protein involved in polysaccharide export with SLBB domain
MRRLLLAILLLVTGASVAGAQEMGSSAAALNPGDAVRITVWRKPDLSGEFFVGADSSIAHPFYSEVKVGGVPFAVATERVKQFVRRVETSPVLVEPLYQVMILGEVRNPRLYPVRPEVTIAQAIGLAGGTTERAQLKQVQLLRGGQVFLVDLTQPQGGRAQGTIRSGDQIVVPRRTSVFRDYVAPAASITSAVVALANLVIRNF